MRADKIRYVLYVSAFAVSLFVFQGFISEVHASDARETLREVNSELRQAERDMFGGKTEEAVASLESIKTKLLLAREADPNNPQVKTLENRFEKLVKDLERRTGKDLGGGTLTAASVSTKPELPPQPDGKPLSVDEAIPAQPATARKEAQATVAQLPYGARRPAQNAQGDLERIDSAIERLSDSRLNPEQLLGNMKMSLESARKNFETAREEAGKGGVVAHPDFDALEAGIAEAEKKIAQAHASHEASKKQFAEKADEVNADVKALKAAYDHVQPLFAKATGVAIHYNDLKSAEALIKAIEDFEENELKGIRKHMQAFAEKYGATREEIDRKADSMGYVDSYYRASFAYTKLTEGIENVEKTRTAMADDLVRRAEDMKDRTTRGVHDFTRLDQHQRIKEWGQMAARFDPENPRVKGFNEGVEAWVKADAKALDEKIDRAVFPKQAGDAPQDAPQLVKAALAFLQKENEKLAAERGSQVSHVLAVSITGPWRVFTKNILGEPIQYNLPIATAVQTQSEKAQGLARVYLSTLLTQEMKGVKMGPPFIGVTTGDSYYIRASAVR